LPRHRQTHRHIDWQ